MGIPYMDTISQGLLEKLLQIKHQLKSKINYRTGDYQAYIWALQRITKVIPIFFETKSPNML
jgi:hypothetical protein